MHTRQILTLAAAVALTGCSAFQSSPTWRTVAENRARIGASYASKEEYVDRLHAVLAAERVEHKIVTYQYRYRTRLREEAVNTASAIIYRDPATPSYPWWLMDENLSFPVWLPNEEIDHQIGFYIRREAEVLDQENYAGDGDAKNVARLSAPPAPRLRVAAVVARRPVRAVFAATERADARPNAVAPPQRTFAKKSPGTAAAPVSSRLFPAPWTSAAAPLRRVQRVQWREISEPRYAVLFRQRNGTRFDPASRVDRGKMELLRKGSGARHITARVR